MSSSSKQDISELMLASVSKLDNEYDTATDILETDRTNRLNHFSTNQSNSRNKKTKICTDAPSWSGVQRNARIQLEDVLVFFNVSLYF